MKTDIKNLEKSQTEITIELSWDEVKTYLKRASERLSQNSKIEGFRPGKAPYDIVRARFGEYAILEAATEEIVKKSYLQAIKENNIKTIGHPHIEVVKIAVNNPFVFKAKTAILPETKLGKYKNLNIKKQEIKIEEKDIEKVLNDLVKMQSKEVVVNKISEKKDKVLIDMDMLKDNVPIEGGQGKNMAVYLSEEHYIPGFNEELVGLKKDDEKEFDLNFPETHYQKHLANSKVHFKIKIKDVYEIQPPKIDDDLAKLLGQKSLTELKNLLKKNLENEALSKVEDKWEVEILNKIVDNSKFSDIPEMLINEETHRMLHELEDKITKQGVVFEDYLNGLGKKESDLKLELVPEAIKRIKVALILREIAKTEKVEINDKEIMEEVEKMFETYKDNSEAQKQIKVPEFTNYLKTRLENKKVIELLKKSN